MKKLKKLFFVSACAAIAGSIYYYFKNGKLPFATAGSYEEDDSDFEEELNDLFDDFEEAEEVHTEDPATQENLKKAVEEVLAEAEEEAADAADAVQETVQDTAEAVQEAAENAGEDLQGVFSEAE